MADSASFGPFRLESASLSVEKDGKPILIGQRGFALLQVLASTEGDTVTKAALMEAAWPDTTVEEGNLTVQIAGLRKALGTRDDGSEWIVTVPRVGYRLMKGETARPAHAGEDQHLPTIIVLPFQNLSGDPAQDYFADGVVEDLTMALSRFRSFAVLSRNTAFVYKQKSVDARDLARDLGVRYCVEGSMRRAGNRMRVTAQLVDAATGAQIWGETFDGVVDDIFDVQDRIAENVVGRIAPHIQTAEIERSRRARPDTLDAYDFALKALPYFHSYTDAEGNAEALKFADAGVALAPHYAYGLHVAAWVHFARYLLGLPHADSGDGQVCVDLARRAIANAKGDPEILSRCAVILIHVSKEYEAGMRLVKAAVEAGPNHIGVLAEAAVAELHCGSVLEAIRLAQRAVAFSPREPLSSIPMAAIAHAHMVLGDYDAALEWSARSISANPRYVPAYWMQVAANAHLGHLELAREWLAKWLAIQPNVTLTHLRRVQPAQDPTRLAAIFEGMRLAGLPES